MSSNKRSICYPYGMGVYCICDSRNRIYKCYPSSMDGGAKDLVDLDLDLSHSEVREDLLRDEAGLLNEDFGKSGFLDSLTGSSSDSRRRGLDERTEIILAATFLVLIILSFIR